MWNLLIPAISTLLDKVLPDAAQAADAKLKVLDLAQKGELAAMNADMQLALGQMEINKAEATTDLFRGGWRPAVGWTCVLGLVYQFLIMPILPWVLTVSGMTVPPLPNIDNATLGTLLFGILGLGGMRSWEKARGMK